MEPLRRKLTQFILFIFLLLNVSLSAYGDDEAWQHYRNLVRQRQYGEAVAVLNKIANTGDNEARYELANYYRNGRGVSPDANYARRLLLQAARENHLESQYLLGVFYEKGIGGESDNEKARFWYNKAAGQHHAKAMKRLTYLKDNTQIKSSQSVSQESLFSIVKKGGVQQFASAGKPKDWQTLQDKHGNNLLAVGLMADQRAMAGSLLSQGVAINHINHNGETALHLAVRYQQSWVEWLLSKKANANVQNKQGQTPLHLAVEKGDEASVRLLVKYGANPKVLDSQKRSALELANILHQDAILAVFAQAGFKPTKMSAINTDLLAASNSKVEPLYIAVERGDLESTKALIGSVDDPWRLNNQGQTVITLAALHGHQDVLSYLLSLSHSHGKEDQQGRNALFHAVKAKCESCLSVLLKNQFDPLQADQRGMTAIEFALAERSPLSSQLLSAVPLQKWRNQWLFEAVRGGLDQTVKQLIQGGININVRDAQGRTVLWYAVNSKVPLPQRNAMLTRLLDQGADVGISDLSGQLILHVAASDSNTSSMNVLLKHIRKSQVNTADKAGNMPLHLAAAANRLDAARLLIDTGADIDARDASGNTPLILAVLANSKEMVKLLLQKGAAINKRNNNKQDPESLARKLGYKELYSLF